MQKWRQSFKACTREKKEEAAKLRKQVTAVWRLCGSNLSPWEQIELIEAFFVQRLQREMGAAQGQMPRREGRRNSEDEQEQGRITQQLVLPTPGGINQGPPASCLELDLPRVRGVAGEGGSAGRSGTGRDPNTLERKKSRTRGP